MLSSLHIQNYALIAALDLNLNPKFNTITGETGAGKSILLGALGLLMGNRADVKVLLNSEEKCIVEANFSIEQYALAPLFETLDLDYDHETIIRREIAPNGKSRAFVNDVPVTLDILKQLSSHLVDIHSQHETLLINKVEFQTKLIDSYANTLTLKQSYDQTYAAYTKAAKQLTLLTQTQQENEKEQDYFQFLLHELDEAAPQADELETLEEKYKLLENTQDIKENLGRAYQGLTNEEFSVLGSLRDTLHELQGLEKFGTAFEQLSQRLSASFHELDDIANELAKQNEQLEFDPNLAEEIKDRINTLNQLCQKHHVTDTRALLEIKSDLEQKIATFHSDNEAILALEKEVFQLKEKAKEIAQTLFDTRNQHLAAIATAIENITAELGMEDARFVIEHTHLDELGANGFCQFNFLFSANKGIAPQPLQKVASGGEFSRLMFAVKYILAQKTALPTLIFDEIDTGISGEVALKMAKRMEKMADQHQTIAITHLPQIAAQGHAHYFVYKNQSAVRAESQIKELAAEERLSEIAKMIGGDHYTEAALTSAKELVSSKLS